MNKTMVSDMKNDSNPHTNKEINVFFSSLNISTGLLTGKKNQSLLANSAHVLP